MEGSIAELKRQANEMMPQLLSLTKECEEMQKDIDTCQAEIDDLSKVLDFETEKSNDMKEQIDSTKAEIEIEADAAKSLDLEKTEQAVKEIEATDLIEKVNKEPPEWFLTLMEAVMTML